jgi:hypothetical protein
LIQFKEFLLCPLQKQTIVRNSIDIYELLTIEFPKKTCEELTDDDIIILATRYNDGPDVSLDYILARDYGKYMMSYKDKLQLVLGDE